MKEIIYSLELLCAGREWDVHAYYHYVEDAEQAIKNMPSYVKEGMAIRVVRKTTTIEHTTVHQEYF